MAAGLLPEATREDGAEHSTCGDNVSSSALTPRKAWGKCGFDGGRPPTYLSSSTVPAAAGNNGLAIKYECHQNENGDQNQAGIGHVSKEMRNLDMLLFRN